MCLIKPDRWEQANIIDHQLHTDHQVREIWVLKSVNPEATSDRNIGAIEISIDRKWNWIESIEKWPRAFVSPIHPCPIEHTKQHKCYGVHTRRLLAGIFIRRPPPNRIVKKCGMIWKTCLQFPVPTGVWQQRTHNDSILNGSVKWFLVPLWWRNNALIEQVRTFLSVLSQLSTQSCTNRME